MTVVTWNVECSAVNNFFLEVILSFEQYRKRRNIEIGPGYRDLQDTHDAEAEDLTRDMFARTLLGMIPQKSCCSSDLSRPWRFFSY